MKKYDNWYRADEGKHFVLTEIGKTWASYKDKNIGEPIDEDETHAVASMIESGALEEVDDPEWVEMDGFKVVYENDGYQLSAGNPIVFFDRDMAERYMQNYKAYPWMRNKDLYITHAVYKGKKPSVCRTYEGKTVYNRDWWFVDAGKVGDLVDEKIVDDIINALPPACMRSDCMQGGEPASCKKDENGKVRNTYVTFKKVADSIYEYCGDCFRGENVMRGTEMQYVV